MSNLKFFNSNAKCLNNNNNNVTLFANLNPYIKKKHSVLSINHFQNLSINNNNN